MKIRIFNALSLYENQDLTPVIGVTHNLGWKGNLDRDKLEKETIRKTKAGKIQTAQAAVATAPTQGETDKEILEYLYTAINLGKPEASEIPCLLNPRDVVTIEDRAYQCRMIDWKRLDDFIPDESKIVPISSLEDFASRVKVGARICTINHHTYTGEQNEGQLVFGDVVRPVRIVTKIEGSKFWLKDFESSQNSLQSWSDLVEFVNVRVKDNRITITKRVGEPGWSKVGDLQHGDEFDWITYWLVE